MTLWIIENNSVKENHYGIKIINSSERTGLSYETRISFRRCYGKISL